MQGYFYELSGPFKIWDKWTFFLRSDKCAYITGFNRGVQIMFPEVYICMSRHCMMCMTKVFRSKLLQENFVLKYSQKFDIKNNDYLHACYGVLSFTNFFENVLQVMHENFNETCKE